MSDQNDTTNVPLRKGRPPGRPDAHVRTEMGERPERSAEWHAARRERAKMGLRTSRLTVRNKDPNYHYRIITDKDSRIQAAEELGYEFVDSGADSTEFGSRDARKVGTSEHGGKEVGYVMRIHRDLYEENQLIKKEAVDAIDKQIHKGKYAHNGDSDGIYSPKVGISIKSKLG